MAAGGSSASTTRNLNIPQSPSTAQPQHIAPSAQTVAPAYLRTDMDIASAAAARAVTAAATAVAAVAAAVAAADAAKKLPPGPRRKMADAATVIADLEASSAARVAFASAYVAKAAAGVAACLSNQAPADRNGRLMAIPILQPASAMQVVRQKTASPATCCLVLQDNFSDLLKSVMKTCI